MQGGWGFCAGAPHGLQLGFGCQVICVLLLLSDSPIHFYFAMGSQLTNNILQTAPVYQMAGRDSGSSTSTSLTGMSLDELPPTTSQAVVPGGKPGISSALASLIA